MPNAWEDTYWAKTIAAGKKKVQEAQDSPWYQSGAAQSMRAGQEQMVNPQGQAWWQAMQAQQTGPYRQFYGGGKASAGAILAPKPLAKAMAAPPAATVDMQPWVWKKNAAVLPESKSSQELLALSSPQAPTYSGGNTLWYNNRPYWWTEPVNRVADFGQANYFTRLFGPEWQYKTGTFDAKTGEPVKPTVTGQRLPDTTNAGSGAGGGYSGPAQVNYYGGGGGGGYDVNRWVEKMMTWNIQTPQGG